MPFAFTEQGVAMLSGILNSDRAIPVNIQIMRTFTQMRHMITEHEELRKAVEELKQQTDERFEVVFSVLDKLLSDDDQQRPHFFRRVHACQKIRDRYCRHIFNVRGAPQA